uniref:V-type proton ATPase subunit C n=1 Tax=Chromera velia CCMP2878 TaxID=1169474 RepID=A0A0G4HWN9_9ALVE|eukprot:Cvel_9095.t1-p1 / transcript=Cvel_9095.t1 / gene=Cvel_9095 / organism=Chromera_velia_CCMP2878 / gene_product=V-type proton ATPase subunit C 1-A, putative / transcript_product=V-type proton ATPase subunit C 1-A, putative / location=Cvel_scaffold516:43790-44998(-) / protein_length=403 / sequence_SO=supercontig / SO=protein_coding / is_pseudo=false
MSDGSFWIIASTTQDANRDQLHGNLRSRAVERSQCCVDVFPFEVPENLKFGSFDDLIRLVDELAKHDSYVEGVVKRVERQMVDIAGDSADLKVKFQFNDLPVIHYIQRFYWDDAKYPRTRSIRDNLDILLSSVAKSDEEVRLKSVTFQELKGMASAASKKDSANLLTRNLIDVLTPGTVSADDFINTEHLATLVVVVPRGAEKEWETSYESLDEFVVPRSTVRFPGVEDKDGNSLWSAVVFKKSVDNFKTAARAKRFTVRDFTYSEAEYAKTVEHRSSIEAEKGRQEVFLSQICKAAFSDSFISWMHLKAMRVFVEAVLRFGVPPNFGAFFLRLNPNRFNEKRLRTELEGALAPPGGFQGSAKAIAQGAGGGDGGGELGFETGEYFPYVSLSLNLTHARAAAG